jgi:hypothetical protein
MKTRSGGPEPTPLDWAFAQRQSTAPVPTQPFAPANTSAGQAPEADPNRIGIVCIHGVGDQKAGEILLQWSGPLIAALDAWRARQITITANGGADGGGLADSVQYSSIDFAGATFPIVRVAVASPTDQAAAYPPREWIFTEAWWASAVTAPSLATMIDWLGPGGVLSRLAGGLLRSQAFGEQNSRVRTNRLGLTTLLSTLTTVALLAFAAVRALAAVIPVAALKDALIAPLVGFITDWYGDAYLLIRDPVQAANVRRRFADAISALRGYCCGRIVVIGHSGGTIVTYTALTDPNPPEPGHEKPVADLFVSHGEAVNIAWDVERGPDGSLPRGSRLLADITAQAKPDRWVDFCTTRDPANFGPLEIAPAPNATPAGASEPPFTPANPDRITTRLVWNLRSINEDHGAYWQNEEEFVQPLLRELDVVGGDPATSRFAIPEPAGALDPTAAGQRRRQRVSLLELWRRATLFAVLSVIALGITTGGGPLVDLGRIVARAWSLVSFQWLVSGPMSALQAQALPDWIVWIGELTMRAGFAAFVLVAFVGTTSWSMWSSGWARIWTTLEAIPFLLILAWILLQLVPFAAIAWSNGDLAGGLVRLGLDGVLRASYAIGVDGVLLAAIGYFLVHRSGPDWRPSPAEAAVLGVSVVLGVLVVVTEARETRTAVLGVAAVLALLGVYVSIKISPVGWPAPTAQIVGIVVAAALALVAVAVDIRDAALGLVVAVVVVSVLSRIGMWRWNAWDSTEMAAVRAGAPPPSRVAPVVIGIGLAVMLAMSVIVFGFGSFEAVVSLPRLPFVLTSAVLGLTVALTCVAGIAHDVWLRSQSG